MQLSRRRGVRCFLAVAGGIQCPVYLGSRATFPAGKFGGMQACFTCSFSYDWDLV